MKSKISAEEAAKLFDDLKRQAQDKEESELIELLDSLNDSGVIVSVESENDEAIWEDDSASMEVVQRNRMLIAGWPVYQWTLKFWGYWGGMGAGWFQQSGDSTLEGWLEELLHANNLLPEDAEVPRPEYGEEEDEDD